MKREIRFRVWDKAKHRMFGIAQLAFDPDGELVSIYSDGPDFSNDSEALMGEKPDLNEAVLMQYTGLQDKNGQEIYESDILRVERDDDPNDFYIAPVSWCGGDYQAFDILSKHWPHRVNYDTNALSAIYAGWSEEVMTVIGNIHEDPELLEAEK